MPIIQVDYSNLDHTSKAADIGLNVKHIPILIESFVQESNDAITKLKDAIDMNDFDQIVKTAHYIKGSSGNLKFNEIYEMAKEMELNAKEPNENFDYMGYFMAISKAISTI